MIKRKFNEANRNGTITQTRYDSGLMNGNQNQNQRFDQSLTFGPQVKNGNVSTRLATEPASLTRT